MAKADGVSVALDERDPFTHAHCDRVAGLSLELGVQCGLLERDLEHLGMAAGFHDVGKIGIPDAVLRKKGALSDAEWVLMKSHATRSERIMLAAFLDDGDLIAPAVRHHHERFDGRGYPDGLTGEAIPILARIIAVADTYDAMARMRVYAPTRTHAEIMAELFQEQGRQHDPYVIRRLAELIDGSRFRVE